MAEATKGKQPESGKAGGAGQTLAIVRVRGSVNVSPKVRITLDLFGLEKPNWCTVRKMTPSMEGMLKVIKDMVTWGPIDEATLKELKKQTIRTRKGKPTSTYTLNPPRKEYGRKGTKQSFNKGGGLGNRKEKINDLLRRMM